MSKIQQYGRQYETFDPNNKKHRKIFHEMIKHKTWGRSSIRFWPENENNNLISQIGEKLTAFYLTKEFGSFVISDK